MSLCLIQPDPWECTGCVNNNNKPSRLHLIFNLEVLPCGPKEIECWPVSWGSLCEVEGHCASLPTCASWPTCFPHASPLCAFPYTPLCVPCAPQGDPMACTHGWCDIEGMVTLPHIESCSLGHLQSIICRTGLAFARFTMFEKQKLQIHLTTQSIPLLTQNTDVEPSCFKIWVLNNGLWFIDQALKRIGSGFLMVYHQLRGIRLPWPGIACTYRVGFFCADHHNNWWPCINKVYINHQCMSDCKPPFGSVVVKLRSTQGSSI